MKAKATAFSVEAGTRLTFTIEDVDYEFNYRLGDTWTLTPPDDKCKWTEDRDGNWETLCGQMFILTEGAPSENKMQFCCYCGKPLEEVTR